jgi:hypothetical protein
MATREVALDFPTQGRLPPLQYQVSDDWVRETALRDFLRVLEGSPLCGRAARLNDDIDPECIGFTRVVFDVQVADIVMRWRATAWDFGPLRGEDADEVRGILGAYLSLARVEAGWVREQLTDPRGVNRSRLTRRPSSEQPG